MDDNNKLNLLEELKGLLKKDDRFTTEGQLLKNTIVEHALKLDKQLIKLLLSKNRIKGHFFADIDGTLLFDKDKFIAFVDNKQFLPNSYTAFKNKIGLTLDGKDDYLKERKDVVLVWPYKDCILEGGQTKEDQKRDEIFWNETLAPDEIDRLFEPKVLTNFKRFDKDGEHKVSEIKDTDNLIIKGNNLLALHSLKKRFAGEVKLIYIDPPFNTGNDEFNYNDSFNHSTWLTFLKNRLEIARQLLKNDGIIFVHVDYRELAYLKILMDEVFKRGNYISQINWQRVPEGRTLLGQGESDVKISTEYLLVYAKEKKAGLLNSKVKKKIDATEKIIQQYSTLLTLKSKPVQVKKFKDSSGNDVVIYKIDEYELKPLKDVTVTDYLKNYKNIVQSVGIQKESTAQQKIASFTKKINGLCLVEYIPTKGKRKGQKIKGYFLGERKLLYAKDFSIVENKRLYREGDINDFWSNIEIQVTDIAGEGGVELKRGKKPEELLKRIISWASTDREIVMDFFLGSGTTAAVAHKMGRQYIGIEQIDYGKNDSVIRLKNVIGKSIKKKDKLIDELEYDTGGVSKAVNWKGSGDFIYCELMQWNEVYVDKIRRAKTKADLAKIWQTMREKGHLSYKLDFKEFDKNASEYEQLSFEDQRKFLLEVLDKNQLYVNYLEIDDTDYKVSEEDKKLNRLFYGG